MRDTHYSDHKQPSDIAGKTIAWAGIIRTEYGRVGDHYLLLKFTDGTRQVIGMYAFRYHRPDPDLSVMQGARDFFTDEEIHAKDDADRARRELHARDDLKQKRAQLERLKKELGET